MLELEAASFVLHQLAGDDEDDGDGRDEGTARGRGAAVGGPVVSGVVRRRLQPGVGSSLSRVRGPRKWRRRWQTIKDVAEVAAWTGRRTWRLARWAPRHPWLAALGVLAGLLVAAAVTWGVAPVVITAVMGGGVASMGLASWRQERPAGFERWVAGPVRSAWRRTWTYRRHWQPAAKTARLHVPLTDGGEALPKLGRVRSGPHFDTVRVGLLDGQTRERWSAAGEQLATSFRVQQVRTYPVRNRRGEIRPGTVELRCLVRDPLVEPVPAIAPPPVVDLAAVPVGVREDGGVLTLPAAQHLLVAGATGAGKSSLMWAMVAGVAPAIAAGTLRIRALDPKRQELAAGQALWDGHCRKGGTEAVRFLEHAVGLLEQRQAELDEEGIREHTPTVKYPTTVILVDEIAALTAWIRDPKERARAATALGLLLSQGRAAGFFVWEATQLPQKAVLDVVRDLTPKRVCMRTTEPEHADLVLGQGARARGALADRIEQRTPGVCYVLEDGQVEPVRGRIAHVTDDDIRRIARQYRRLRVVPEAAAA